MCSQIQNHQLRAVVNAVIVTIQETVRALLNTQPSSGYQGRFLEEVVCELTLKKMSRNLLDD